MPDLALLKHSKGSISCGMHELRSDELREMLGAVMGDLEDVGDGEAPCVFTIDDDALEDDVTDNPEDMFFSYFVLNLSEEEYKNSTKAENDDN